MFLNWPKNGFLHATMFPRRTIPTKGCITEHAAMETASRQQVRGDALMPPGTQNRRSVRFGTPPLSKFGSTQCHFAARAAKVRKTDRDPLQERIHICVEGAILDSLRVHPLKFKRWKENAHGPSETMTRKNQEA